jgi:D-sedoheptulose 7-phosphate isomerase
VIQLRTTLKVLELKYGCYGKGIARMNSSERIKTKILEIQNLLTDPNSFSQLEIENLAKMVASCFASGKKIAFVGNGGSAAEAMHIAAEFTGKCVIEHKPLPAICLNESQSALTAIANDYGVDFVFSRMVEAHLNSGDILIALSTSGSSINILNAMTAAIEKGAIVYLWTGDSMKEVPGVIVWNVPSLSTPRIQEIHLMWGHILAEVVEEHLLDSISR